MEGIRNHLETRNRVVGVDEFKGSVSVQETLDKIGSLGSQISKQS